jgi:hypothetical protein
MRGDPDFVAFQDATTFALPLRLGEAQRMTDSAARAAFCTVRKPYVRKSAQVDATQLLALCSTPGGAGIA